MADTTPLAPCPFCGGPVQLEEASPTRDRLYGERRWYGVVCRNTTNIGGSCAMEQIPSASKESAIARWNRRASQKQVSASAAEFALNVLVAAGHVSQELVDRALALPGAPTPATRKPLTDEQAISLCKMGPVHAPDGQVVRTPGQYRRELEDAKFAGIRKAERAHGIT